jgi:GABA permease
MNLAPLPKSRVLVLIADEICGRCLARELADRGEGAAGASVVIVAPALVHSATAAWTDDIDAGIAEAERKVDASVALLRRQGYATVGKVGDSNPIRAIEDGLAEFAPDSVIVATHPADRMGLLERELVDRLAHGGTRATWVVMAPDGEYPVTPRERGYAPGRTRKSGLQADDRRATAAEHR